MKKKPPCPKSRGSQIRASSWALNSMASIPLGRYEDTPRIWRTMLITPALGTFCTLVLRMAIRPLSAVWGARVRYRSAALNWVLYAWLALSSLMALPLSLMT
ncbi:hypothetical protein D3C75_737650 [compost metagenome]